MQFEFAVESQMKCIVVSGSRMNEGFLNIHIIIADSLRIIQIVKINQNKRTQLLVIMLIRHDEGIMGCDTITQVQGWVLLLTI